MALLIRFFIGFIFAVYGVCSVLTSRKNQAAGKLPLGLACLFAGFILLGYGVYQIVGGGTLRPPRMIAGAVAGGGQCRFPG